jgi:hypothetical protein
MLSQLPTGKLPQAATLKTFFASVVLPPKLLMQIAAQ